jgi:hypothetical protein
MMTMAAGVKLFVNASFTGHQAISVERHRREKWLLKVGSRLLREIQLPLYLKGDRGDIGLKRGCERKVIGALNLTYLL